MPRRKKIDPQTAVEKLARMYAKYFVSDDDKELELNIDAYEARVKAALPREYKKIEATATNLALGHRG